MFKIAPYFFLLFIVISIIIFVLKRTKPNKYSVQNKNHILDDSIVTNGMLNLMAALIKTNNSQEKNKIEFGMALILKIFGVEKAKSFVERLNEVLKEKVILEDTCRELRLKTSYQMRENLTHLLFRFSFSDGEITEKEIELLQLIGNQLAITGKDYQKIRRLFIVAKSSDFSLLGIPPTSDKRKIKAAYRQLAKKYHPDGMTYATEFEKNESTSQFRKIQEAYERISNG